MAKTSRPIHVLVPVKDLDAVKHRLSGILTPVERQALVLAMLDDVLTTVQAAALANVSVLSPDPRMLAFAESRGARPLRERPGTLSLNDALEWAVSCCLDVTGTVLVLLADTPLVGADELIVLTSAAGLVAQAGDAGEPIVVIATDRSGSGTNALLQNPARAIPMRFGQDSLTRHLAEAHRHGIPAQVCRLPGLALDLDTMADLRAFLEIPGKTHTHDLLRRIGVAERLEAGAHERSHE